MSMSYCCRATNIVHAQLVLSGAPTVSVHALWQTAFESERYQVDRPESHSDKWVSPRVTIKCPGSENFLPGPQMRTTVCYRCHHSFQFSSRIKCGVCGSQQKEA